MRDLNDYQYILWDWNGTLLNDIWLVVDVVNRMLRTRGLATVTADEYRSLFRFPVEDYYRAVGFDLAAEPFPDLSHEFLSDYNRRADQCSLHEGARDTLARFSKAGVAQWVLSATRHDTLQHVVARFGLADYFRSLQGLPDHLARSKAAVGSALIREHGIDPELALLVGDTTHDFEVARELGADCLLVAAGHQLQARLETTEAPVVPDLASLWEI